MRLLMIAFVSLTLLAGCTQGGQTATGSYDGAATINYQGSSTGTQSETARDCDTSGTVNYNFQGSGTIRITVKDGGGSTIFSKSLESAGQGTKTQELSGKAGDWTLTVARSGSFGGFSGQYNVNLVC